MQKGYTGATMQDLCRLTGLSRGGLYRYFSSVEEVFLAMLGDDRDAWREGLTQSMKAGASAKCMLEYYLARMREGILRGDGALSLAAYEYVLGEGAHTDFAKTRYDAACDMFAELLAYGQSRGEFAACDARGLARCLVVLMDGLRIAARAIPLNAEEVDAQLDIARAIAERGTIL